MGSRSSICIFCCTYVFASDGEEAQHNDDVAHGVTDIAGLLGQTQDIGSLSFQLQQQVYAKFKPTSC